MKINYLGHACFKIEFDDNVSLICDPFTKIGYEMKRNKADILTCSHKHYDHYCTKKIESFQFIENSGEYSFKFGDKILKITGVDSFHDEKSGALRGGNVIYKFEYCGITLCHMGDIGERANESLLKKIGKVDVLFIPVGGTYTVDADGATEWIEKIMPKIVIPMHYKQKTCTLDIDDVNAFLKLNEDKKIIRVDKFVKIDDSALAHDTIEIIEMSGEKDLTAVMKKYEKLRTYLNTLSIHDVRNIARAKGAVAPTSGQKEGIIDRIVAACSGAVPLVSKGNGNSLGKGAPPKSEAKKEQLEAVDAIVAKIKAEDAYDYEQEISGIVWEDGKKSIQRGYGSDNVACGFVDFDNNGNAFLITRQGLSYTRIIIPEFIVNSCNLRCGDKINAYCDENGDGGVFVGEIISINAADVKNCQKRSDFDDFTPCYVNEKIDFSKGDIRLKAVDSIIPVGKGQRTLISAPSFSGKSELIKRMVYSLIEGETKLSISVLLNAVRPEEITSFKNMARVELFATSFSDSPALQVQIANLAFENAKRLAENGKDVILFVDGIGDLACAYAALFDKKDFSTAEIKKLLAVARNTDGGGSVTVIATIRTDDDDESLAVYRELKRAANMEIYLSRSIFEQRVFPPIDFINSYNYALDCLLLPSDIKNISTIKKYLAENGSLAEVYNAFIETDGELASVIRYLNR